MTAGAQTGARGAVTVEERIRAGLPDIYAAGDCVVTHHRLLGVIYLPLGTTAHKQGRVAGENAVGGEAIFAGSLGTQVVKVFDLVAGRTGLRDHEAVTAGFKAATTQSSPDDHKALLPNGLPHHDAGDGGRRVGHVAGRSTRRTTRHGDFQASRRFCHRHLQQHDRRRNERLDLSYSPRSARPGTPSRLLRRGYARTEWVSNEELSPVHKARGRPRTRSVIALHATEMVDEGLLRHVPAAPGQPLQTRRGNRRRRPFVRGRLPLGSVWSGCRCRVLRVEAQSD